jgi:beta-1,2-mannobiose phosphorylase / 1,2-beta-oligomannan phosphorylase
MPTKRKTKKTKKKTVKRLSLSARLKLHKGQRKTYLIAETKSKTTAKAKPKQKAKLPSREALPVKLHPDVLLKHHGNPIIEPRPHLAWESKATFNPGAVEVGGKIHLLYRAIGDNDISVVGHAVSYDGLNIAERSDEPAYIPELIPDAKMKISGTPQPNGSGVYVSGGGWWGGSEDPRATYIKEDSKVYMLYVAFDGWSPPRVAMTSIDVANFLAKKWDTWSQAKVISMPPEQLAKDSRFRDVVDKNACLLPEKINGKYVIFHRIFPDILVDFVDDLDFEGAHGAEYLKGEHKISPRPGYWDSRKVGAGAPPIKTKDGWLLIYQAVGDADAGRYKIGAMMLDLHDPTKVLYRCNEPVLSPEEWYENTGWKSGVVYPCGAVEKDGTLFVYYGGADSVVCVATAKLDEFIDHLKKDGAPKLVEEIKSKTIKLRT